MVFIGAIVVEFVHYAGHAVQAANDDSHWSIDFHILTAKEVDGPAKGKQYKQANHQRFREGVAHDIEDA